MVPLMPRAALLVLAISLGSSAMAGLVVTEVRPGYAAQSSGLQAGDRIRAIDVEGGTDLNEPFQLMLLEDTYVGRAARVEVERGAESLFVDLPPYDWGLITRPDFSPEQLAIFEGGLDQPGDGPLPEGWSALLESAEERIIPWLWLRGAKVWAEAGAWDQYEHAIDQALSLTRSPAVRAYVHRAAGVLQRARSRLAQVERNIEALREREAAGGPPGPLARELYNLGSSRILGQDLMQGVAELERALPLAEELRADFLRARIVDALGISFAIRGRDAEARTRYEEANQLFNATAPNTNEAAMGLSHVALLDMYGGDFRAAETGFSAALDVARSVEEDSFYVATVYNNLGILQQKIGDLAAADQALEKALQAHSHIQPDSLEVALALGNLGNVAARRHDHARAAELFERELELFRRHVPESRYEGDALYSLALVHKDMGNHETSESFLAQALAIDEIQTPNSAAHANAITLQGQIRQKRGDTDGAIASFTQARAMHTAVAPGGYETAGTGVLLGRVLLETGDTESALDMLRASVETLGRLAPESTEYAQALHALGRAERDSGEPETARDLFLRAIDALEAAIARLGGSSEAVTNFRADHAPLFHDAIDLLMRLNDDELAFETSERYRAQSYLTLLASRPLLLEHGLPADIQSRRRAVFGEIDAAHRRLRQLSGPDAASEAQSLRVRLTELHRQREDLRAEIAQINAPLAELTFPRHTTVAEAQTAVDGLALSYVVGRERTYAFALGGSPAVFQSATIEVSREDLTKQVSQFRTLLALRRAPREAAEARARLADELRDRLIAPFSELISNREHITVVPDGPLHILPFAALGRASAEQAGHLIEDVSLSAIASITALRTLDPVGPGVNPVYAFGDPLSDGPQVSRALRGGSLSALPYSRTEVEQIAALFGDRAVVRLGNEATEANAKSVPASTDVLHIAAHGVVDHEFPLESFLLLSTVSEESDNNGLLKAWEIMESMRVDAKLVALSACDSGLGLAREGEGMLGLTRAFHYAGADSVLATLWPVADRSTAAFMATFYRHWTAGHSRAEALRQAQLEFLRGDSESTWQRVRSRIRGWFGRPSEASQRAPLHWAGFQIFGAA